MPTEKTVLSDENLGPLLAQTRWGSGGIAARIDASPNPRLYRALRAALPFYRLIGPFFQRAVDQARRQAGGAVTQTFTREPAA